MLQRTLIVTVCLLAGAAYLARAQRMEEVPPRESLDAFPYTIQGWKGTKSPDFDEKVLAVLGVDEYVIRMYQHAGQLPVSLYVGYYGSQRQGDTMHSPLNCLPGAGWVPISTARVPLGAAAGAGPASAAPEINRITIQKGLDRQVVLYWYQSHNRVVASEHWGKVYTVLDAIRYNRTDAAMIRIVAPVPRSGDEAPAERAAMEFAASSFPVIGRFLPS